MLKYQLVNTRLLIIGKQPHICVLSQLADQLVFRIQSVDADGDEDIHVLYRNMLLPIHSATTDNCNLSLEKANEVMDLYFDN